MSDVSRHDLGSTMHHNKLYLIIVSAVIGPDEMSTAEAI